MINVGRVMPDICEKRPLEPIPRLALTVEEAALALSLSPRTVQQLVADGKLPAVKVGRRVLLPVAGLERWLTENSAGGSGVPPEEKDRKVQDSP